MPTSNAESHDCNDQQILRQLPGVHLDKGEPCACGIEHITTRSRRAFSDSRIFTHRCTACGNEFSTWIEG